MSIDAGPATLGAVLLDESVYRFDLLSDQLLAVDGVWYSMRASENRVLYGDSAGRRARVAEETPRRRYFNCFYGSFKKKDDTFYANLLAEVLQQEFAERVRLNKHQHEEFCAICRYAGNTLGVHEWIYFYCTSLPITKMEELGRRMIQSEFWAMLLEAVCVLEVLHRRTVMFVEEPTGRRKIGCQEVPDWIECRRRQVERERREELARSEEGDGHRPLDHFNWRRQQAYQVFLFEQSEQKERIDVERLQGFHAGVIAKLFFREHREARYHQLKYELRQRLLPAELSRDLVAQEATARSALMLMQHDHFHALQADEVKSYLWTKRNAMLNEDVERRRGLKEDMCATMWS